MSANDFFFFCMISFKTIKHLVMPVLHSLLHFEAKVEADATATTVAAAATLCTEAVSAATAASISAVANDVEDEDDDDEAAEAALASWNQNIKLRQGEIESERLRSKLIQKTNFIDTGYIQ